MVDILVVDDEKDICWALENALGDEGYHITQVNRGEDAIREVKQKPFAVAIVDVKLPGMSGIEVSRVIGQLNPDMKIVMISGYHYPEDQPIQEGIRRKVYRGFISKPFDLDEVSALVRRLLAENENSSSASGEDSNGSPMEGEDGGDGSSSGEQDPRGG